MAIYAIGDVQGCREQLESLLDKVNFDPAEDFLWFAGDIVNRGPESLATLQLIYSLRNRVELVLGNHDLHLLAVYHSNREPTTKDTLTEILEHPDAALYLDWLIKQPLLVENEQYVMCHAGIYPGWSITAARVYAREVEKVLSSDMAGEYFSNMYGNDPEHWDAALTGMDRYRFITNAFTRMRYCKADGGLDMVCKKPPSEAPADLQPWFQNLPMEIELWSGKTLLIGHWASLMNQHPHSQLLCLDSGCVWGKTLSAFELTEKRWFQVPGLASPTYT